MATDYHWIIERRHPIGSWHAVVSSGIELACAIARTGGWQDDIFEMPFSIFGRSNETWFEILSALGSGGAGERIMERGLPADASPFSADMLDWEPGREAEPGHDLHSHGHQELATLLRRARDRQDPVFDLFDDPDDARLLAAYYADALEAVLDAGGPDGPGGILDGLEFAPGDGLYLDSRSNHRKMMDETLRRAWTRPEAPGRDLGEFRLLITYDN